MAKATVRTDGDGSAMIELAPELLAAIGLRVGDDAWVYCHAEERTIFLQGLPVGFERTVVEDRFGGLYSKDIFIAWPLSEDAIPSDSQGGDVDAATFWSKPHLAGKGPTPEAALADLEHILDADAAEPSRLAQEDGIKLKAVAAPRFVMKALAAHMSQLALKFFRSTSLIVRNAEPWMVLALKKAAAAHGRSVEAEHREILRAALSKPTCRTFSEVLLSMPDVGTDEDFRIRPR